LRRNELQSFEGLSLGQVNEWKNAMEIKRVGSQSSAKDLRIITGTARVDSMFQRNAPAQTGGGIVTFEPGARTAWHTHPLGQTLIVINGCGWVQREGGPIEQICPGDVVWFGGGYASGF
jgi:quercetin dioxygenase-like cupin family protein